MNQCRRRSTLVTLLLLTSIIVSTGLWMRAQRRQYALDRQLIAALVKSDIVQALALVKQGADPNTSYTPSPAPTLQHLLKYLFSRSSLPDNNSPTAILIACGDHWNEGDSSAGNVRDAPQLVQTMLEHGANIEAKDVNQGARTPLLWAVESENPQTVRVLLEHGAYANATTPEGETPLIEAIGVTSYESTHIIALLIEHGADTNAKDKAGDTPLMVACIRRSSGDVRVLLEHGANPNALSNNGTSVLDDAMEVDSSSDDSDAKDILLQLLEHGADPNLVTHGVTPLQEAQVANRPDLANLLPQHGSKK